MKILCVVVLALTVASCSKSISCKPLMVGQIISLNSGDQSVTEISKDGLSAKLSGGARLSCVATNSWASNEPVGPATEVVE
jgi:hypothetical protein